MPCFGHIPHTEVVIENFLVAALKVNYIEYFERSGEHLAEQILCEVEAVFVHLYLENGEACFFGK